MEIKTWVIVGSVICFLLYVLWSIHHTNKKEKERGATELLARLNNETQSEPQTIVAAYHPYAKTTLDAHINNPHGFKKVLHVSLKHQDIQYGFKKGNWELLSVQ